MHAAVLAAATELVAESGYAAMSLDAVAARARAGKDTIYRRWSGKTGSSPRPCRPPEAARPSPTPAASKAI
ncbi:helix-turn-helix domain-containing protein [Streptomyces sp. enrichment culture]|uniref:helix-turn-helix domain-containing protein n=1 Tax=Streptomyces sp. enrichment culture TaxID=1795815 RepID=UPI003F542D3A